MPLEEFLPENSRSFSEVIRGKDFVDTQAKLDACLLDVEKRHQDYFDSLTEQASENERPVQLSKFIKYTWDGYSGQFIVDSNLRADIAAACYLCAETIIGGK